MRTFSSPPRSIIDPATSAPAAGAFLGDLPEVDLSPLGMSRLFRFTHRKRWSFATIATDDLLIALAVVHLGYALKGFVFAFDGRAGSLRVDRSFIGPTALGFVGNVAGAGACARMAIPFKDIQLEIKRPASSPDYHVRVAMPEMRVDARLSTLDAPPPLAVIAPLSSSNGRGLVDATEKRALLPVSGEAVIRGERRSLDGGFGGLDYTHGYLPRHTAWRWVFVLGRAKTGERVGLNLTQGFVGELECVAFVDKEVFALPEPRVELDPSNPLAPMRVHSADGAIDLRFEAGGAHRERDNFGIIAAHFLQAPGLASGSITLPGEQGRAPLELERVLGVVEDQDVLW